jgi:cysteinyl-tRNA synthetase
MRRALRACRLAVWASALQAMLWTPSASGAEGVRETSAARATARHRLAAVKLWGCQYQNIDLARIAASPLDLVVIEQIVDGATGRAATREEIAALKTKPDGSTRLVVAYLSVGAAEEYRPYWRAAWKEGPRPKWLGEESSEWPRSYSVRYWEPEWRAIVADAWMQLVRAGYDGVFLDRVDAFHDWRDSRGSGQTDMVDLVAELGRLAREVNPAFLIIGQNAEQLLLDRRYIDVIDAVSKESLLTGLRGEQLPNSRDDIEWSLSYLLPAKAAGLTILSIEYLRDRPLIDRAAREHESYGFVPFFATRLLDRLP